MRHYLYMAIFLLTLCPAETARATENNTKVRIGTTFSKVQTTYLDMDWQKEYLLVLDCGFDLLRLGAYWNNIEKIEGEYDFSDLDWQIEQAEKKNTPIILTVGMKAPRWPEYFIPQWLLAKTNFHYSSEVSKSQLLREKTLAFITQVIKRYQNNKIIHYWQVENEPFNHTGPQRWWIGKQFLNTEIALVKKLDSSSRPVMVNTATYPNKFLGFFAALSTYGDPIKDALAAGDILGINIYFAVGSKMLGANICHRTTDKELNTYLARIVRMANGAGKEIIVTELQAEPWDPGKLVHTDKGKPLTSSPEKIKKNVGQIASLGIDTILLWGVEYWHYRGSVHGEKEWWQSVEEILESNKSKGK